MDRRVTMIAAYGRDGVLGKGDGLPWPKHPEDMRRFRQATLGNAVIMGRKTFDTLARPLPYRQNIVVSRTPKQHQRDGIEVVSSLEDAIRMCGDNDPYVIGGAAIYMRSMAYINRILLTEMKHHFTGDVYFKVPFLEEWNLVSEEHWTGETPEQECVFKEYVR